MTIRRLILLAAVLLCQPGAAAAQFAIKPAATNPQSAQPLEAEDTSESITIPAGTAVLMSLRSPLNTVSAESGAGLYLETISAVIQQNRVVIPAKTLVQGTVQRGARPGRVKGRGQLQFHFTTMILPSNYTASIAGSLQSLPGSRSYEKTKHEGTIQPVDQIDKDATVIVRSTSAGALLGSISHGAIGAGGGALIGAAFGLGSVLFKRGDDISLPVGTEFEMILDRSLTIPLSEVAAYSHRTEPLGMRQNYPSQLEEKKVYPLPNSVNVAKAPGGVPEFRFEW